MQQPSSTSFHVPQLSREVTEKEPTPFSHFPQRGSPCHGSAVAKVLPKSMAQGG